MIYSVSGKLMVIEAGFVVVDVAGVGYKCFTSSYSIGQLPSRGAAVCMFTHLHVREDVMDLYGFVSSAEVDAFRMLISVSGVGPKAALGILSSVSPDRLMLVIASGDVKGLKAPGVGPKIAQRIILELKDKVGNADIVSGVAGMDTGFSAGSGDMSAAGEAISALAALGYSQADAAAVVAKMDSSLSSQDMIKAGLKLLASRR